VFGNVLQRESDEDGSGMLFRKEKDWGSTFKWGFTGYRVQTVSRKALKNLTGGGAMQNS